MTGHRTGSPNAGWVYPTRTHPAGHTLVLPAINRATALATLVRDEGPESIARILDPLNRQQLYALVVALAALVPDDRSVRELLAWLDRPPVAVT